MRQSAHQGICQFSSPVTSLGVGQVLARAARALFARGRGVAALAAALLAAAALVAVGAAPALATVPGPDGSGPVPVCSNGTCSVTYAAAGAGQAFTVPPGVSQLEVTLYGAVGGGSAASEGVSPGGDGAKVAADLAVTAGLALGVDVGGAGQTFTLGGSGPVAGGVNGGGGASGPGGGGGGGTDLSTAPSGGTVLLEAGGGGGAGAPADISGETQFDVCVTPPNSPGNEGAGGNADTVGGTGQPLATFSNPSDTIAPGTGGGAGTADGPGAAGTGGVATVTQADCGDPSLVTVFPGNGSDGAAGSGGTGATAPDPGGGGGGGGYTGGGAGGSGASVGVAVSGAHSDTIAAGGGGGGGASYTSGSGVSGANVTDTGNTGQVNGGNGEVVLSYPDPVATGSALYTGTSGQQLTVTAANGLLSTVAAGTAGPAADPLTASGPAGGTSADGGTVNVNPDGSFSYTPPPGFVGLDSFGYTVADAAGDYATGTVTLQVQFITQAITFTSNAPSPATVGGTYAPAATGGGSGKPVVFSIDPASSSVCSISGGVVTFTAGGTCTIDANQAGSGVYLPAPQVSQSVTVQISAQSITFTSSPPSPALVNGTYKPAATGGGSGNPVVFTIDPSSASVCSISGGTVTFTAPGTCQIDANQDGNAQFSPAPQRTQSVTVQLIPQSIILTTTAPNPAAAGGSYRPQATGGGSGSPVVFSIDPASTPVCSISGGTVTFTRAGTCTVDANQAGVPGQYAAAPQASQVIAVDQAPSFVLATPQTSAALGQVYGYVFAASGTPAPAYALAAGAPSWLSVSPATGAVTGTPPAGTKSFTYSVTATNAVGTATAGPFTVHIVKSVTGEDVGLTLSCPATLTVGATGSCTLTATNHGTAAASGVTVAALLPATLAETACTSSCTSQGNAYTWTLSKLAKQASASFTITVTATAAGSGQILAVAATTTFDPNIANNAAAATIGTSH